MVRGCDYTTRGENLMVVADPASLTSAEADRKALMESWGYTVTLIDDDDSQANFDTAVAGNDIAYIPANITELSLGIKLSNAAIGIVNEANQLHQELGLQNGGSSTTTGSEVDIVDNTHYITEVFPAGVLTITNNNQSLNRSPGNLGEAIILANTIEPGLAVIETGSTLKGIGGIAAGRRAFLPWGGLGFDFSTLNSDGQIIMQRAIEWAAGEDLVLGPIAHWKFDEGTGLTAIDSEGGHDGTLTSSGPSWTTGIIDGALDFDGVDDRVQVPDDPALGITDEITLYAWIRPNSTGTQYFIRKAQYDSVDDYELSLSTTGKVFFRLNQDTSVNTYRIDSTTPYPTNGSTWMQVVATFDGAVQRLYINGVEEAFANAPVSIATNDLQLSIGGQVTDPKRVINGALDDVRLYDRALSATEVADLYAANAPAGAADYTELYQPWNATGDDTWQTVNLGAFGVPANAVVEVAVPIP